MRAYIFKLLLLFLNVYKLSYSANWAQSSGYLEQNTVIPYIPSPNNRHWEARYGMVAIVVPPKVPLSSTDSSAVGYAFILGGDSYQSPYIQKQGNNIDVFDYKWYNGYKNDVWRTDGTEWYVKGNIRLRTAYGQKVPEVYSQLTWDMISAGLLPPAGMTYDNWIKCESYFVENNQSVGCDGVSRQTQWSPRRHHVGIFFNNSIWIMGGRSREIADFPILSMIGGLLGPRVQDILQTGRNAKQSYTTQREASVLRNDIWNSNDGKTWKLVTPGCKRPQLSLVPSGNDVQDKYGQLSSLCATDKDCYGNEKCDNDKKTCYCPIWSPREQHAISSYGKYMYISGGYVSQLFPHLNDCGAYACGDTYSSNYRFFMSDIWRSPDGLNWTIISEHDFPGLGGHQMQTFNCSNSADVCLYIIGGQSGDSMYGNVTVYQNIWYTTLVNGYPTEWKTEKMPWPARFGHTVVYEEASGINNYIRRLYVIGGMSENETVLDDVWVWRIDIDSITHWNKDFTSGAYYSAGIGQYYVSQNNSPTGYSDLKLLQKFFIPTRFPKSGEGVAPSLRPYLTIDQLVMLNSVGLYTINDLASAGLYTILKLRGYDFPQVPQSERLTFTSICDVRALAIAVVKKCNVNLRRNVYDGEQQMPWNVIPEFGGPIPTNVSIPSWHGISNYDFLLSVDDPTSLLSSWDGCTYISQIEEVFGVNVDGLGWVQQVKEVSDPHEILQELVCKQTPGGRVFHSSVMFEQRVYLFGGISNNGSYLADTWYRDSELPTASFLKKPPTKTSAVWFEFQSNKPGVIYEYRVISTYKYKEIRPWTQVTHKTSVAWLNWRVGGPSNGYYTLYVRAVDPAGNKDAKFYDGQNVYTWYYVSPTPWDIILEVIFGIIGVCILGIIEYRRRLRKSAMERYAMKRMRRKFKALQRDIGETNGNFRFDWRLLYTEQKNLGDPQARKKAQTKKKNQRDQRKERREKEKKRRDKEKERIKKKLREVISMKDSRKVAITDEDLDQKEKAEKQKRKLQKKKLYEEKEDDNDEFLIDNTNTFNSNQNRYIDEEEQRQMIENQKVNRYKSYEFNNNELSSPGNEFDGFSQFREESQKDSPVKNLIDIERYKGMSLASEPIDRLEIEGTKQRRTFKRYKDYEISDMDKNNSTDNIDNEKKVI